jgi:hypothetical protein
MNWGDSMRTPSSAHFPDISCHEIREFPMSAPPPQVSDVGNAASDVKSSSNEYEEKLKVDRSSLGSSKNR